MCPTRHCRLIAACLFVIGVAPVHAEDQIECSSVCESGERMVSYADGNNVTCSCVPDATMDETVADPSVHEGEITQDS